MTQTAHMTRQKMFVSKGKGDYDVKVTGALMG